MAGKQVAALILLLVAVGSASAYSYRPRGEQCEREVEEQMPMRSCMMWAESKMRREPYADGDAFFRIGRRYREEHLDDCCEKLRQVSSECRCQAVKEMMMEMPQGQMEMQRMMCSLPTKCRMSACSCPRYFD
ncbi:2S sulfur-rich seed storage protein 1-like [Salvia miltiorrhiza]|uniref:2S sulfur-rich seed storage protein 1-like n=1 Tax=Salvia miltiorrhiza TaxID=226208 RepID=UPI0025AC803C|nr:2S sulfur-rich seed storage protein 1-like [Salvia miltiorrhiza]